MTDFKQALGERFDCDPDDVANGSIWIAEAMGLDALPAWLTATIDGYPGFDYAIRSNRVFVPDSERSLSDLWAEIACWLVENLKGRWYAYFVTEYYFEREDDAAIFKLRFG